MEKLYEGTVLSIVSYYPCVNFTVYIIILEVYYNKIQYTTSYVVVIVSPPIIPMSNRILSHSNMMYFKVFIILSL